jgi:hypothetical protein
VTRPQALVAVLAAAAFASLFLALEARRARDRSFAEFRQLRVERERLRAELARLERRPVRGRPLAPGEDAAAARALRGALLEATRGLAVGEVQIAAQPEARGGVAARGRIAALGSQAELLRAADRLAQPASGVLLERVELAEARGAIRLEASAVSLRAGP